MTPDEKYISIELERLQLKSTGAYSFCSDMRFIVDYFPDHELNEVQHEYLFRLLYTYKHKLPEAYEMYKDNPLCSPKEGEERIVLEVGNNKNVVPEKLSEFDKYKSDVREFFRNFGTSHLENQSGCSFDESEHRNSLIAPQDDLTSWKYIKI